MKSPFSEVANKKTYKFDESNNSKYDLIEKMVLWGVS